MMDTRANSVLSAIRVNSIGSGASEDLLFVVHRSTAREFSVSGMVAASHPAVASAVDGCRVSTDQGSNQGASATETMRGGLKVLCIGAPGQLVRSCVDCGLITGCFCDSCTAVSRLPNEDWAKGQLTPLCSHCDEDFGSCHFCRGKRWCAPEPHK